MGFELLAPCRQPAPCTAVIDTLCSGSGHELHEVCRKTTLASGKHPGTSIARGDTHLTTHRRTPAHLNILSYQLEGGEPVLISVLLKCEIVLKIMNIFYYFKINSCIIIDKPGLNFLLVFF